jgi:hypothetical protein
VGLALDFVDLTGVALDLTDLMRLALDFIILTGVDFLLSIDMRNPDIIIADNIGSIPTPPSDVFFLILFLLIIRI